MIQKLPEIPMDDTLKARFMALTDEYLETNRYTLCHGDSQISNFLKTDKTLKLMDWEFTGNNDPIYDVACFGNNNFDHALALLPVYLKRTPELKEYNRLYFRNNHVDFDRKSCNEYFPKRRLGVLFYENICKIYKSIN